MVALSKEWAYSHLVADEKRFMTDRRTDDGQTASLLLRLPQSSQRLDLGALSIRLRRWLWMQDWTDETRDKQYTDEWCCGGAKTWGLKLKVQNPKPPLHLQSWPPTRMSQWCNGSWQMEMSPLVGVRVMMRTCIKQASSPLAPTTVECMFVSSSSDRSAVEHKLIVNLYKYHWYKTWIPSCSSVIDPLLWE